MNALTNALTRLGLRTLFSVLLLAGLPVTAHALSCPGSMVEQAGLCYEPARDGYSCDGPFCMEGCRDGYSPSLPGFCQYRGSTTYTVSPSVNRSSKRPHKCMLLFYDNCRANYRMDACGICTYKGAWTTTRHTYLRTPGISPDFSQAFNRLPSVAQATYGAALGTMHDGYDAALDEVQRVVDEILLRLFRDAARRFSSSADGQMVLDMTRRFVTADADTMNSLKRVLVLAGRKSLSDAERQDIVDTMVRLGRQTNQYLSTNKLCSIGVHTGAAGAFYGGAVSSFGVIANCWPDADGRLQIRVVSHVGATIGYAQGANAFIGMSRAFGPVDSKLGISVGLVGGFPVVEPQGVDGSVNWSIASGMRGAQNAKPTVFIASSVGAGADEFKVNLSLEAGFTTKLLSFAVTPTNP
jgi:hypothetical protein